MVQHRRRGRRASSAPRSSCRCAVGFASASLLFLGLLSDEIGPVNDLLVRLGLVDGYVSWTSGSPSTALGSAVVLVLWRFAGFNMLILLTGLQAIPLEVYEAARHRRRRAAGRSSAGSRCRCMRPTIALVLTLMITGSLLAFDQFWILTRGGPDNSTTSLVMVIYREAFIRLDLGSAAAISVVAARACSSCSTPSSSACCAADRSEDATVTSSGSAGRCGPLRHRRGAGHPVPVPAAVERLGVGAHRRPASAWRTTAGCSPPTTASGRSTWSTASRCAR